MSALDQSSPQRSQLPVRSTSADRGSYCKKWKERASPSLSPPFRRQTKLANPPKEKQQLKSPTPRLGSNPNPTVKSTRVGQVTMNDARSTNLSRTTRGATMTSLTIFADTSHQHDGLSSTAETTTDQNRKCRSRIPKPIAKQRASMSCPVSVTSSPETVPVSGGVIDNCHESPTNATEMCVKSDSNHQLAEEPSSDGTRTQKMSSTFELVLEPSTSHDSIDEHATYRKSSPSSEHATEDRTSTSAIHETSTTSEAGTVTSESTDNSMISGQPSLGVSTSQVSDMLSASSSLRVSDCDVGIATTHDASKLADDRHVTYPDVDDIRPRDAEIHQEQPVVMATSVEQEPAVVLTTNGEHDEVVMTTSGEHGADELTTERCSPRQSQLMMTSSVTSSTSEIDNNIKAHVIVVDQQEAYDMWVTQTFKALERSDSSKSTVGINSTTPLLHSSATSCKGTPEVISASACDGTPAVVETPQASSSSSREDLFYPKIIDSVTAKMKPEIVDWLIKNSKSANRKCGSYPERSDSVSSKSAHRKSGSSDDSSDSVTSLATNSTDLGEGSEIDRDIKINTSSSGSLATYGCPATANPLVRADADNENDLSNESLQVRRPAKEWKGCGSTDVPVLIAAPSPNSKSPDEDRRHVITGNSVASCLETVDTPPTQTTSSTSENIASKTTISSGCCNEDNSHLMTGSCLVTSSYETVHSTSTTHTSSLAWQNISPGTTKSPGSNTDHSHTVTGSSLVDSSCETVPSSSDQTSFMAIATTISPGCNENTSLVITGSSFGIDEVADALSAKRLSLTVKNKTSETTVTWPGCDDEDSHVPTGNTLVTNHCAMCDMSAGASSLKVENQTTENTVLAECSEFDSRVTTGNRLLCSVHNGNDSCSSAAPQSTVDTWSNVSSMFQLENSLSTLIDASAKMELDMTSPPQHPPAAERSERAAVVPAGGGGEKHRSSSLALDVVSGTTSDHVTTLAECSSADLMLTYGSVRSQSSTAAQQHHPLVDNVVTSSLTSIVESPTNTLHLYLTGHALPSDRTPEKLLMRAEVVDVTVFDASPSGTRSRSERKTVKIERIPSTIVARYGRSVSTTVNSSSSGSGCPVMDTSSYSFRHAKRINQSMTSNKSRDHKGSLTRHVKWPSASVSVSASSTKGVVSPKSKSCEKNDAQTTVGSSPKVGASHRHVVDGPRSQRQHPIGPTKSISRSRVSSAGSTRCVNGQATLSSKWSMQMESGSRDPRSETRDRPVKPIAAQLRQPSGRPPVHPVPTRSSALRELLHANTRRCHHHVRQEVFNKLHNLPQHRPETDQRLTVNHRSTSLSARSMCSPANLSSPLTSPPCTRSRHRSACDRTGRSSPSPTRMRSESTGARYVTVPAAVQYPTPTRTSEMRRAFSRMTPRHGATAGDIGGRLYRDEGPCQQGNRQQHHSVTNSARCSSRSSKRVRTDATTHVQDKLQHRHHHHHNHHHDHHHHQQQQQQHLHQHHVQEQQLRQYPPQQHRREHQQHQQNDYHSRNDDVGIPQLSSTTRSRHSSRTHRDRSRHIDSPISEQVYHQQSCVSRGSSTRPIVRTFLADETPTIDRMSHGCRSTNSSPRHHLWLCSQERRSTTVRYTSTTSDATGSSRWPGEDRESWSGLAVVEPVKGGATYRPSQDFMTNSSLSTMSSKSRRTRFDKSQMSASRPGSNRCSYSSVKDPSKSRQHTVRAVSPPPPFVSPQRIRSAKLRHKFGIAPPLYGCSAARPVDIGNATSTSSSVDEGLTGGDRSLVSCMSNRRPAESYRTRTESSHRSLQHSTATLPTTRSFRYSRFHRRVIDTVVPDDIRLMPDRWAMRTARLMDDGQSPER